MPENFNKPFDDHSNAAMSHTSEGAVGTDFVIRELDLNKEQKYNVKVKLLARCLDTVEKK